MLPRSQGLAGLGTGAGALFLGLFTHTLSRCLLGYGAYKLGLSEAHCDLEGSGSITWQASLVTGARSITPSEEAGTS